jgi:hypothetical protein
MNIEKHPISQSKIELKKDDAENDKQFSESQKDHGDTDFEYLYNSDPQEIEERRSQMLLEIRSKLDKQKTETSPAPLEKINTIDETVGAKPFIQKKPFQKLKTALISALSFFTTSGELLPAARADEIDSLDTTSSVDSVDQDYNPIVDIEIAGRRVLLDADDIEKVTKNFPTLRRYAEITKKETYDPEMEKIIIEKIGEKLAQGLLLAKEKGFEISSSDTYHCHLLVERTAIQEIIDLGLSGTPDSESFDRQSFSYKPQVLEKILDSTKALIFHCAEFPSSEELSDPNYWLNKFQYRTIVSDGAGTSFLDNSRRHTTEEDSLYKKSKEIKGYYPNIGGLVEDYNTRENVDMVDTADAGLINIDIKFWIDANGSVIDKNLPPLKICFSKKDGVKKTTLRDVSRLVHENN